MDIENSMAKECTFCNFIAPTLSLWLSHVRAVHSTVEEFEIECCGINYNKCSSFVSHVYRKHRNELASTNVTKSGEYSNSTTDNAQDISESAVSVDATSTSTLIHHTVDQLLQVDHETQKKESALFLLHLKEGKCLSQSAVNEVVYASQRLSSIPLDVHKLE